MQNENEYTDAAGVRYQIKTAEGRGKKCTQCAHEYLSVDCISAPVLCDPMFSGVDNRIIWVKAEAGSQK